MQIRIQRFAFSPEACTFFFSPPPVSMGIFVAQMCCGNLTLNQARQQAMNTGSATVGAYRYTVCTCTQGGTGSATDMISLSCPLPPYRYRYTRPPPPVAAPHTISPHPPTQRSRFRGFRFQPAPSLSEQHPLSIDRLPPTTLPPPPPSSRFCLL